MYKFALAFLAAAVALAGTASAQGRHAIRA